jgi:hypothetical protein
VYTSLKRLVAKTVHIVHNGNSYTHVIAFDNGVSGCVFYDNIYDSHPGSSEVYPHGVDLFDVCDLNSGNGSQAGAGLYTFTIPSATVYTSLSLSATGLSLFGSGTIYGGWDIIPTSGSAGGAQTYPVPNGKLVTSTATHGYGLGTVSPAFHITKTHQVFTEFDLTNDNGNQFNDFDLEFLTMTVNYKILQ